MLKVKHKKSIAILLSALFIASSAGVNSYSVKADAIEEELHNPVVEYNECELVTFGHYWQKDTNNDGEFTDDEKQPIEWRVLKKFKEDNQTYALLLSEKVLDCQKFYDAQDGITWKKSDVRSWLQGVFPGNAFTPGEEGIIKNVKHYEDIRYKKGDDWIEDVEECDDQVFLLSAEEVIDSANGFNENVNYFDPARETKATEYAIKQGIHTSLGNEAPWWLRSEGKRSKDVADETAGSDHFAIVDEYGLVDSKFGNSVDDDEVGIRPAVIVKYKSNYLVKGNKVAVSEKRVKWDTVTFGNYNGQPLKWRVLNVDGNDAFLVTDDVIGQKKYNDAEGETTWKDSSLRKWLNEDFYDSTFTADEQGIIIPTTVKNENKYYDVSQEDTTDKVSLLSIDDVTDSNYGFFDTYTVAAESRTIYDSDREGMPWWLRSPGMSNNSVTTVVYNGSLAEEGYGPDNIDVSVRPAIHIDISKGYWEKGEAAYSGEDPETTPTPTITPTPTSEIISTPTPTTTPAANVTEAPTPAPTPAADSGASADIATPTPSATPATDSKVTPTPDPLTVMGEDGTPYDKGASVEAADKAITSLTSENDPAGTCFNVLQAKMASATKSAVKISWQKVPGAVKYQVYASKCGNNKPVLVASTIASKFTLEEINGKDLTKGTYYKLIVVAVDKDNKVVSTSTMVHAATKGGKAGNVQSITTKAKKNKISIKTGKTFKLKAKQKNEKKYKKHRVLKYESSNTDIATVSSSGVIKGEKQGKCEVYVYAQNGLSKKIKVTVK